ncbi:MAG: methylmalonyl-CoA mutase [Planctomycetes bacterium]|nr:methylmalonyl-CoA mutase [Planctomycetota bacterium]
MPRRRAGSTVRQSPLRGDRVAAEDREPAAEAARWKKERYEAFRAKRGERKERFATSSEIPVEPVYVGDARSAEGLPGEAPFTRGIYPTMYRGRLWTMRQYAGFASASETNRRFRYLLDAGQTGLSVAFDLPTQIGYESDHPLAEAEMGKVGVPINSLRDMEVLLASIPLDRVSTSMTINSTAPMLLAMYVALAKRQGVPSGKIRGTVQNDLLKEYVARGTYRFPVAPSMRLVTDIVEHCSRELPGWNPISISGYHMREAGCTAVQEVAFTLAHGLAYVQAAVERGLDVDHFGAQLSFFFNAHNDFFEEIAKFRAARRLWARLMEERFGAKNPEARMLRFHTQTAGSMLTSQQPDNNIVRVTVQALAAVLGGTQSLHTNSRDEALGLPTEVSARIALRTQQILACESGVADVADPLGGSPFVEALTDQIEERARVYLRDIDGMGGAIAAIEKGFPQREIHRAALRWQREVESGARTIVGVNDYQVEEEPPQIFKPDPAARDEVLRSLDAVRKERDGARAKDALDALEAAARGTQNLFAPILHAVESYCTIGEMCARLERVFGKYQAPAVF